MSPKIMDITVKKKNRKKDKGPRPTPKQVEMADKAAGKCWWVHRHIMISLAENRLAGRLSSRK